MIVPAEGEFRLNAEADAARLGAAIGAELARGEAVCLTGPLGAGKSVVARGLIRKLCPREGEVPSPTFTLAQTYEGAKFPITHFDLYRLARADEVFELGLDDALKQGAAVIEWGERLGQHLPANRIDISIALDGEARRARLSPHGAWEGRPIDF